LFISIHSIGSGIGVDVFDEQAVSARGPLGATALKHTRVEFEFVKFEFEFEFVEFKLEEFEFVEFEFVEFDVKFEFVKFEFVALALKEFEVELALVLFAAVELAAHEEFADELAVPMGLLTGPRAGPAAAGLVRAPPTVELEVVIGVLLSPIEVAIGVVLDPIELPDIAVVVLSMELADIVVEVLSMELADIAVVVIGFGWSMIVPGCWSCKSCLLPTGLGWKKSP
jgi:hypothetical protein